MQIPIDLIDSIREAAPLDKILEGMYGKVVQDRKTVCDFHDDDSPSLHLYDDGGYKCFACGAGKKGQELVLPSGERIIDAGNSVFGYIMNKERIPFADAVRRVGEFIGIDVPEAHYDPEVAKMKKVLTDKNRDFYNTLIENPSAMTYLSDRGIGEEEINKWRIGMVPWNWADKRFAGRIVFGLIENNNATKQASTIGLAYRVREYSDYVGEGWMKDEIDHILKPSYKEDSTPPSLNPKYYNDPKSKIYDKSNYLYGYNYAQAHLRTVPHNKRYVVLVEGYVDVILAHKQGLHSTVACCGTSFTDQQADLIARQAKKIYLWFDPDVAGQRATAIALTKLLERGCDVLIVNSSTMDPADVAESGKDMTEFILHNSKPAIQLVLNNEIDEFDTLLADARAKVLRQTLPVIESISDPVLKLHYKNVLADRLKITL